MGAVAANLERTGESLGVRGGRKGFWSKSMRLPDARKREVLGGVDWAFAETQGQVVGGEWDKLGQVAPHAGRVD